MIDDAVLALLGPIMARIQSVQYGLPKATNQVNFQKVS